MYPIDGSAAVSAVKKAGVDLKKKYIKGLDAIYSSEMERKPSVPKFEKEEE